MEAELTIQAWHWLVLGLVLLTAEALGAGGFVIGLAIAAFVQSLLIFFLGRFKLGNTAYYLCAGCCVLHGGLLAVLQEV